MGIQLLLQGAPSAPGLLLFSSHRESEDPVPGKAFLQCHQGNAATPCRLLSAAPEQMLEISQELPGSSSVLLGGTKALCVLSFLINDIIDDILNETGLMCMGCSYSVGPVIVLGCDLSEGQCQQFLPGWVCWH